MKYQYYTWGIVGTWLLIFCLLTQACTQDDDDSSNEPPLSDSLTIQTILLVYTPASKAIAEQLSGDLETHSAEIIEATNKAYEDSGILVRLEIADVRFINFNFTQEVIINNPNATSVTGITALVDPSDGIVDEIHEWRNEVKADIAILKNDFCGGSAAPCQSDFVSSFLGIPDVDGAFALVGNESCTNNPFTLAHEVGHLQGCNHQPGSGATNVDAPYANGFVGNGFRTIMCTAGADRVGIFSSPNLSFNGQTVGTEDQNDCVRAINETAEKIAAFR